MHLVIFDMTTGRTKKQMSKNCSEIRITSSRVRENENPTHMLHTREEEQRRLKTQRHDVNLQSVRFSHKLNMFSWSEAKLPTLRWESADRGTKLRKQRRSESKDSKKKKNLLWLSVELSQWELEENVYSAGQSELCHLKYLTCKNSSAPHQPQQTGSHWGPWRWGEGLRALLLLTVVTC